MKRFIDFSLSLIGLVMTLPLYIVFIPWIRLTSDGPAIFRQDRVGKGQKVFTCYKFRTMTLNTKQAGTHEISESAVTSVGKILRRTKLDELPQLINVLRGEMSLVGPRPCLPVQAELIKARESAGVFEVLPGVTGLGQVRGVDMSDPDRLVSCDSEYISKRSLWFDFKLIYLTVAGAGKGDRVSAAESG